MVTDQKRLHETLARLYPNANEARRVATDAGLREIDIDFSGAALTFWWNVLAEAEKQGKLEELVRVVCAQYPKFDADRRREGSSTKSDAAALPSAPPDPSTPAAAPRRSRWPFVLAAACLLVVVGLLAAAARAPRATDLDHFVKSEDQYALIERDCGSRATTAADCFRGAASRKKDEGARRAAVGDRAGALVCFLVEERIRERLLALEPSHPDARYDLCVAHGSAARACEPLCSVERTVAKYRQTVDDAQCAAGAAADDRWRLADARARLWFASYLRGHYRNWDEFHKGRDLARRAIESLHRLQERGALPPAETRMLPRYEVLADSFPAVGGMYGR